MILAASAVLLTPAFAANQAVLSWGAVSKDVNGNPITGVTYNVYTVPTATSTSGGTMIASGITALTYTATGLAVGSTTYYTVTAVANGMESAYSNVGSKSIPFGAPAAPVLTVN